MIPLDAGLQILGFALASAVIVTALAFLALRRVRRLTVSASIAVIVASTVVSVIVGVLVVSGQMFISGHDLRVTLIVVFTSGVVSAVSAWWLTRGLRAEAVWSDEVRERERMMEAGRRELVAWVSHDLRTPLAGIRAMAEALEDGVVADPESVTEYHRRLREEADRMTGLVDDLFELSRIHAGALQMTMAPVNLAEVLSDALASAAPLAQAKRVQLTSEPIGSTAVNGSEPDLGRIVRNLLTNAIRFTPSDGTVAVEAGRDGSSVWFTVSDTCGGIPPADLPRVFDVAFRGEVARSKGQDTGGGLGLAITRSLVEAHQGDIDIHNVGEGCQVTVRIPALG